jgi:hypothetical protein
MGDERDPQPDKDQQSSNQPLPETEEDLYQPDPRLYTTLEKRAVRDDPPGAGLTR